MNDYCSRYGYTSRGKDEAFLKPCSCYQALGLGWRSRKAWNNLAGSILTWIFRKVYIFHEEPIEADVYNLRDWWNSYWMSLKITYNFHFKDERMLTITSFWYRVKWFTVRLPILDMMWSLYKQIKWRLWRKSIGLSWRFMGDPLKFTKSRKGAS